MRIRVTYLNDNGYAVLSELIEAPPTDVDRTVARHAHGRHPIGRYGLYRWEYAQPSPPFEGLIATAITPTTRYYYYGRNAIREALEAHPGGTIRVRNTLA